MIKLKKFNFVESLKSLRYSFAVKEADAESSTPILDEINARGIDVAVIEKFIDDHGDLMLGMFDCVNIRKRSTRFFPKWTKDQAFYEAQSTPRDVFEMIKSEIAQKDGARQRKIHQKKMKDRYKSKYKN